MLVENNSTAVVDDDDDRIFVEMRICLVHCYSHLTHDIKVGTAGKVIYILHINSLSIDWSRKKKKSQLLISIVLHNISVDIHEVQVTLGNILINK